MPTPDPEPTFTPVASSPLSASITTEQLGSAAAPVPAELRLSHSGDWEYPEDAPPPRPQKRFVFRLPTEVTLDGTGFATCSAEEVAQGGEGACDETSRVGSGSGSGVLGAQKVPVNLDALLFNAPGGNLTLYVKAGQITSSLLVKVETTAFGRELTINIPENVAEPVPNTFFELRSLSLRLGARTSMGASFVRLGACPSAPFEDSIEYGHPDYPNPPDPKTSSAVAQCELDSLPEPYVIEPEASPDPVATATATPTPTPSAALPAAGHVAAVTTGRLRGGYVELGGAVTCSALPGACTERIAVDGIGRAVTALPAGQTRPLRVRIKASRRSALRREGTRKRKVTVTLAKVDAKTVRRVQRALIRVPAGFR